MPGSAQGFTLADAAELAGVIGALTVVAGIWKAIAAWLRATVLSRLDLTRRLNKLACGVTGDYVTGLFGPPAFRRTIYGVSGQPEELSERIYRRRHAWLQVVVSASDDAVQSFSITVTDRKFRFMTRHLTFDQIDVRLGGSRFSDVSHGQDGWRSFTGARRFGYAESHYFGNPGCYQSYVLAFNDAGTGDYEMPGFEVPGPEVSRPLNGGRLSMELGYKPALFEPLPEWLRPARDRTTVNTLTVLGAEAQPRLADIAGVDKDRVRVLRDPRNERRARRRARKMMRRYDREAGRQDLAPPAEPGELPAD